MRFYKFLNDFECIYPRQFGFRPKHSTNHALISITEEIRQALDSNKLACGIFVDFQKAFDTFYHNFHTSKLNHWYSRSRK